MPEKPNATRVWMDWATTRKLHIMRAVRPGIPQMLCGYSPPLWTRGEPVIEPREGECCRRCLSISKRRKRDWPR